ncbi:hypothetical protein D8M37_10475, partial [Corynebacterium pseudodiphtheriticum]|uniref:hypothetical protein n=1 Tax=Corynebacterium pseudodiphtheriticum TaxID=37637 RepID=UPI000F9619B2
ALNAAMLTTDLSSAPTSRLSGEFPRPFGPLAEDGAPQYDLLRGLGQGAFGEVVRARDRVRSEGDNGDLVGVRRQSGGAVERLPRQFPHLEAAIRDAAALNAAMLTTDLSSAPTSRLSGEFPRPFGPLAEDGAPQYDLLR